MAKTLLSDKKKLLSTALVVGEVVLIAFLLTISLIAMFATPNLNSTGFMAMILWFQNNTSWLFILIVLPLIVLFLLNVYFLVKVLYTEKKSQGPQLSKEELLKEAKRQAREEIMKEMEEAKQKETK